MLVTKCRTSKSACLSTWSPFPFPFLPQRDFAARSKQMKRRVLWKEALSLLVLFSSFSYFQAFGADAERKRWSGILRTPSPEFVFHLATNSAGSSAGSWEFPVPPEAFPGSKYFGHPNPRAAPSQSLAKRMCSPPP